MPLTVGVIGVGKIGRKHATIVDAAAGVKLGPLVDIDEARARKVADRLGATAADLDTAIETADALFVCTPDDEHVAVAARAIDAGLHTLVEKPLATSTKETERLVAAAEESDATHMVGHVLRFDPRYRSVKDTVDDGDLGDVVTVTMERFVKRARIRRTGAVSPPWLRLGVHDFDLLEWLVEDRVTSLVATESAGVLPVEGYDINETVSILAELGDSTAVLAMGFSLPDSHHGSIVEAVVAGTDGMASVDASAEEIRVIDEGGERAVDTHLWPDIDGVPDGALESQDRAFMNAIRRDGGSPIPFTVGHRSVQIAEAVGTAVEENQRVKVPVP
jgi:predicted dehydrogenase